MTWLLDFLARERSGILVLLLASAFAGGLTQWILWMFGWGRFRGAVETDGKRTDTNIRYVLTDFFVKIIDDFRNLLALIVVMLFAVALFAAMAPGIRAGRVDELKDGLQAVAAALGGLIGSIIGYYFGESAGRNKPRVPKGDQAPSGSVEPDTSEITAPEKPKASSAENTSEKPGRRIELE